MNMKENWVNKWNKDFERQLKIFNVMLCIFLLIFITLASLGWMRYFQCEKELKNLSSGVDAMFRQNGSRTIE